jgi:predicted RNase H-like HicB family nuclease
VGKPATSVDAQGRRFHYTVVFERAEEGGYVAHVPALPGLWTQGETLAETRAMVKEAILGYIEGLIKSGERIPLDSPLKKPRREVLEVAVPA